MTATIAGRASAPAAKRACVVGSFVGHAYTLADVERIARTLGGPAKKGSGWDCRCPCHDDRKASLSLSIGEGGKLLWNCHAGCDQREVLDGLRKAGVLLNGDAREAGTGTARAKSNGHARPRIVATYDYTDENGALLFQVVRYDPKDFRQRRPDGNGAWVWSVEGVRRVLYRLPEVLAAGDVIVVEGEKDALNLTAAGFCATTNPMGGSKGKGKWLPSYTEALAGKHVTIIGDNDATGRAHARRVAGELVDKSASVKLVRLDGAKDPSDWLAAGHSADELRELTRRAEPVEAWKLRLEDAIDELNAGYFVVMLSGKGVIASVERDGLFDRERLVFSRPQDVKLLYANRHYQVGVTGKGAAIWKGLGEAWVEHPRRRTYQRLALVPKGPAPPGTYNLWRGWGLEPKAGGWPKLREHLLEVICGGDKEHFRYLVRWCAYCVQHPDRPAEVAVVLRGKKGTGKGTVAQVMVRIFRDHALQVTQSRHLTGNFNSHLLNVLFLFVDEAFWAGDRQGEGTLKALITEHQLMIEPKGVDPFQMPNRLKIMMSSNNDWVVPASEDERRYFVLDVSEARKGDRAYWDALHAALDNGERAAFLDYLLTLDLGGFSIRDVPHTKGLNRQKLQSLGSVERFWFDCLREGAIYGTGEDRWPEVIPTQRLHAAYLGHATDHRHHPVDDWAMVQALEPLWKGCDVKKRRPAADPETGKRPPGYRLDTLEKHRAAFAAAMGMSVEELGCDDAEEGDGE